MEKKDLLEAGRITNTHGIAGEVKIEVWLDSPEFFKKFRHVYLENGTDIRIKSTRIHKGFLIAKLEGVDDMDSAQFYKGQTVYIDKKDAKLPRGSYFIDDLLGALALDEDGREVGTVTDVMESPAAPILIITGESEHLVPAISQFIVSADTEKKTVTLRMLEGL